MSHLVTSLLTKNKVWWRQPTWKVTNQLHLSSGPYRSKSQVHSISTSLEDIALRFIWKCLSPSYYFLFKLHLQMRRWKTLEHVNILSVLPSIWDLKTKEMISESASNAAQEIKLSMLSEILFFPEYWFSQINVI